MFLCVFLSCTLSVSLWSLYGKCWWSSCNYNFMCSAPSRWFLFNTLPGFEWLLLDQHCEWAVWLALSAVWMCHFLAIHASIITRFCAFALDLVLLLKSAFIKHIVPPFLGSQSWLRLASPALVASLLLLPTNSTVCDLWSGVERREDVFFMDSGSGVNS